MTGIYISTLGRLAVISNGQELVGITAQPVRASLLVYLAVERDVTRDAALVRIWPDNDQADARHALSQTLYQLRRDLGTEWFEAYGAYLRATPNLGVDTARFTDAVESGRYADALDLYRGPFLDACHLAATANFEIWVDRQRGRLARLHRKARREALARLTHEGRRDAALEVAREWVRIEPLADEAQQHLISLLAESGARAEAVRQYAEFARILGHEDLEPLPETTGLVERLGRVESLRSEHSEERTPPLGAAATQVSADSVRRGRPTFSRHGRFTVAWLSVILLVAATYWFARRSSAINATSGRNGIRSVAVLPFENLTKDSAQMYFTDGIHEALIADISRVSDLTVISRTSVLRYRGTTRPIPQIARELKVDAVVEGSVLWAGDSVRIQANLIDAIGDSTLATVVYVRDLRNVLGLIRDISRGVAGELAAATTERNEGWIRLRPIDPAAYEKYLKARYLTHDFRRESWLEAVRLYELAIALDSSFAPARAGLAESYFLLGFFAVEPRGEAWARARVAALEALELDEDASEAHTVLGYLALYEDWDWDAAEVSLLHALRLDPNDALARHGYADLLTILGRPEEGLRQVKLGRDVDPLSPLMNGPVVGHLYITRRYDDMLVELRRLRVLFDRPEYGQEFLVAALWQLGRLDEAIDELRVMSSEDPELLHAVEHGYSAAGPRGAMRAAGDHLAEGWYPGRGDAYSIARYYARAGALDASLEWLERAYRERTPQFLHAAADPAFDVLRSDPRFAALRRRIGLPPDGAMISGR